MVYRLSLKTAPTVEPFTTEEAKTHLRISTLDEDTYIDRLIKAARVRTESVTSRALLNQTWNYYMDSFPSRIQLPRPPLGSVTSVKYVDQDGVEQTLSNTLYTVDTSAEPGLVYMNYNGSWPDVRVFDKAINVEYVAGYGAASTAVPEDLLQAMLLLIGHLYENREAVMETQTYPLPMGYEALVFPYRILKF